MTNQLYPSHLSIASSSEIEQTARQLRMAHEQFVTTGILPHHVVRPIIRESWQRCRIIHVNPSLRYAPLAISHEDHLAHLRETSQLLMRAAKPVMSYLSDYLADSGYVIVLSDADGCLLEVIGDTRMRRRLARIDFVSGGDWSEEAAGTNALGTAIADGHVVQLLGAEHYCVGWHDLTCTAAPIRHPLSGEILGILDITGDYHLIRPFLSNFIAVMALQVQQEIRSLLTSKTSSAKQSRSLHKSPGVASPHPGRQSGEYARTREQHTHNTLLLAAAFSDISASLDIDSMLEKIAEHTVHLLHLESTSVCLFDENDENALLHTWSRQDARHIHSRSALEALPKQDAISLMREREEPFIIDDILASAILPPPSWHPNTPHSVLLLPLTTARGTSGFILAPQRPGHQWPVDDILLGLTLAVHAATAIEHARMLHSTLHEMDALREAERLKSSFITAVSHDLQSPLTAIRASVESLIEQGNEPFTRMHEHLLQNIAGQANHLDGLIDQLLDLSRIEAGVLSLDRDWVELPIVIADTIAKFEELHKGIQVEQELANRVPLQYIDSNRFIQVIWNLLENAVKYASSHPVIKVEVRLAGSGIIVSVIDHGAGVPVEEREKIFQHFYRLRRDRGTHTRGSGLGLAICQGIVQAHGGHIWVESQPDGGSAFRFTLPPPSVSLGEPELLNTTALPGIRKEER